jgi:hypothetical protein
MTSISLTSGKPSISPRAKVPSSFEASISEDQAFVLRGVAARFCDFGILVVRH